jgi:hypothetical protein
MYMFLTISSRGSCCTLYFVKRNIVNYSVCRWFHSKTSVMSFNTVDIVVRYWYGSMHSFMGSNSVFLMLVINLLICECISSRVKEFPMLFYTLLTTYVFTINSNVFALLSTSNLKSLIL